MEVQNKAASLAVLWKDSRTYHGNLGEFEGVKKFNGFDILLVVSTLIKNL